MLATAKRWASYIHWLTGLSLLLIAAIRSLDKNMTSCEQRWHPWSDHILNMMNEELEERSIEMWGAVGDRNIFLKMKVSLLASSHKRDQY